jgi:hypothetical protein
MASFSPLEAAILSACKVSFGIAFMAGQRVPGTSV